MFLLWNLIWQARGEIAMNMIFLRINSKLFWIWETGMMIAMLFVLTYCSAHS